MTGFQLAVCSEMVFTDLPLIDRVRRIDELGFAVEIWSWHDKDLDALAATGEMWLTAQRALERIGELGAAADVTFCVENLNTIVDHPGVPLARAKDTLALIEGVGHPNVRMMLDLYHAQIGEGNLIELIRRCGEAIGEVQVADVPGRCEPGTGEIYYPAIAKALRDIGFAGTVGMEAWASGESEAALRAFRAAFT